MQIPSLPVPLIGITGKKNSGKTTLVEGLVREITRQGWKVCTIKHHQHAHFEMDTAGKDSHRHYEAGAAGVIIASSEKIGYYERVVGGNDSIAALVRKFPHDTDLVLMEGFHRSGFPRIEVSRIAISRDLIDADDSSLIAVASDYKPEVIVPVFDINAYSEISEFIIKYVEKNSR